MEGNKKLIYAEDLRQAVVEDKQIQGKAFAAIMRHLNAAPAVDAKPVVRGHWIVQQHGKNPGEYTCCCSECKTEGSLTWKCCPVCTAWMDGGAEDGK